MAVHRLPRAGAGELVGAAGARPAGARSRRKCGRRCPTAACSPTWSRSRIPARSPTCAWSGTAPAPAGGRRTAPCVASPASGTANPPASTLRSSPAASICAVPQRHRVLQPVRRADARLERQVVVRASAPAAPIPPQLIQTPTCGTSAGRTVISSRSPWRGSVSDHPAARPDVAEQLHRPAARLGKREPVGPPPIASGQLTTSSAAQVVRRAPRRASPGARRAARAWFRAAR